MRLEIEWGNASSGRTKMHKKIIVEAESLTERDRPRIPRFQERPKITVATTRYQCHCRRTLEGGWELRFASFIGRPESESEKRTTLGWMLGVAMSLWFEFLHTLTEIMV